MKYEEVRNEEDARTFYGMCAAVAVKGLIVANPEFQSEPATLARNAFDIADAMMLEWERRLALTGEIGAATK